MQVRRSGRKSLSGETPIYNTSQHPQDEQLAAAGVRPKMQRRGTTGKKSSSNPPHNKPATLWRMLKTEEEIEEAAAAYRNLWRALEVLAEEEELGAAPVQSQSDRRCGDVLGGAKFGYGPINNIGQDAGAEIVLENRPGTGDSNNRHFNEAFEAYEDSREEQDEGS